MAKQIINCKIDVTKIDKNKLFKGEKGTYLDCTILMNDAPDQYGNMGMIVQDVTKAEREAGHKGAILGNVKVRSNAGGVVVGQAPAAQPIDAVNADLPF